LLLPRFGIDNQDAKGAWQGIFSHKNFCGYVLVFLMTPVFFLRRRGFLDQIHRIAYCLFLSLIIVSSQSRTGWTSLFVLFVLVALFQVISRFRNRDAIVLAFCLFLVFGVVACASFSLLPVIFVMMGKDATLNGRVEIWQPVILSILKHPLAGYGYCAFWRGLSGESGLIASTVGWVPPHAHNGFLNVALQVGIPGLMVLMAAWFVGVREAILRFRMGEREEAGWYLTLLILNSIVNISEPTLLFYNNLVWLMFLMACVGAKRTARS
jgi:exopolysaccharide production protein ExoQ